MAKSNGKRVRRRLWIGALAVAIVGAGVAAARPRAKVEDEKGKIKTAKAEVADVQVRVTEVGSVEPQESYPWCTIQHAAGMAQPGDTVFVRAGNYPEIIRFRRSGSAEAGFIVFRNYQKDVVTISPGYFNGWNHSYIKIIGFCIQNPPRGHPGIEFSGNGSYVEIRNNEVTGCQNSDAAAIRVGGTMHHFIIDGNHVHHNDTGTQEAVRVHMRTHDFEITHNKVHHNTNIGIDVVGWSKYGKPFRGVIRGNIAA